MRGYNFTTAVRGALAQAREHAGRLQHEYVGTEHLLLGLLQDRAGTAAGILDSLQVSRDEIADVIVHTVGKGRATSGTRDLPYTSRAKKVLELAMMEARSMGNAPVGTEHLLIGLLAEEKGIAAQILVDWGITLDGTRTLVQGIEGREQQDATPRSRVLVIADVAAQIASERGCGAVAPEHFVLALLQEERGRAMAALTLLGADRPRLTQDIEVIAPREERPAEKSRGMLLATPFFQRLMMTERQVSRARGERETTDNLLTAILDHHEPVAAVFARHQITAASLRRVLRDIDE